MRAVHSQRNALFLGDLEREGEFKALSLVGAGKDRDLRRF